MLCSKKGLTLIEIVLAVAIMAFGIVPIMRFAPAILKSKKNIEDLTECIFLGTSKIEEIRGRALADFSRDYTGQGAFPRPHAEYNYSVSDDMAADIKTITVATWGGDSPDDKFVLHTKIATRGRYIPTDRVANFTLYRSYHWIQDAVNDATVNNDIRAKADIYYENVVADVGIVLRGGYNDNWDRVSVSIVDGSMTFDIGDSRIEWFAIQ